MRLSIMVFCVTLILGCGDASDDSATSTREEDRDYDEMVPDKPTEEGYEETDDFIVLPKCDRTKPEKLVYVKEEETFLICREGAWSYLMVDYDGEELSCEMTEPLEGDEDTEEE